MALGVKDNGVKAIEGPSKIGAEAFAKMGLGQAVEVETLAERRYLWTARAFAIVSAVSLCCNIVLLLAIFQVLPMVRIEPFLLTFYDKDEQIVRIKPMSKNMNSNTEVTETFIRQYVLLRQTFVSDIAEMKKRWSDGGPMQEMSAPKVYKRFMDTTARKALALIKEKGLTRSIRILSANRLKGGLWQVQYETKDMEPDSDAPNVLYWTASLRVGYRRKRVEFKERLKNPLGFTVVEYAVSRNTRSLNR
jgi:type IV secretory pathway component VirB8